MVGEKSRREFCFSWPISNTRGVRISAIDFAAFVRRCEASAKRGGGGWAAPVVSPRAPRDGAGYMMRRQYSSRPAPTQIRIDKEKSKRVLTKNQRHRSLIDMAYAPDWAPPFHGREAFRGKVSNPEFDLSPRRDDSPRRGRAPAVSKSPRGGAFAPSRASLTTPPGFYRNDLAPMKRVDFVRRR